MKYHPEVIAAALAQLDDDGPRDVITRVRTTKKQKEDFAKCAAAKGLPSATHAYNLMMNEVKAHGRQAAQQRTGASRRPVRPMTGRRNL